MKKLSMLMLALAFACATSTPTAPPKSEFRNLQVLPQDISREQLLTTMRGFTRGLGVRCNHCHVVTATEPKEQLDFPNDAKDTKRNARVMIQMVSEINGKFVPRVAKDARVSCWTCHRGKPEPESPPPPPAQH